MTSLLQILVGTCWVIHIFFSEANARSCNSSIRGNCSSSNSFRLVHVRKRSATEDNNDNSWTTTSVQDSNKKETRADEVDYTRINPKCQVHSRGLVGLKTPSSADCIVLPQVVDELATEIILVFNQHEQTIGFYVFEYWNIINQELKHFEEIYSKFEQSPEPTILDVVQNVSQALDYLKIITLPLQRKIAYMGQLGTSNETLEPINETLPVRHEEPSEEGGDRVKRFLPEGIFEHLNVFGMAGLNSSDEHLTEIPSDRHPTTVIERLENEEYINATSWKNRRKKRHVKHEHHVSHKKRKLLAMGRKIVQMADSHNCSRKNNGSSGPGGGGAGSSGSGSGSGSSGSGTGDESSYQGGSSSGNYSGNWWGPLKRVILHLKTTTKWMTFLQEFSETLATYEVQSEMRNQKVRSNFSDWIGNNDITNDTLHEALERLQSDYHLKSLQDSLESLVTEQTPVRLAYLNEMVHAGMKVPTKCTVENGVMNVTGSFVFMSEIINCFNDSSPTAGSANVTKVNVAAAHKLFIDQDLNSTSGPSVHPGATFGMYVFAPDWEVIGGKRELSFAGAPATDPEAVKPGDHGKPGAPGGPGSSFYAIVDNVTGGEVSILAHGGKGGKGYDGTTHPASDNGCAEPQYVFKRNKNGRWEFLCQAPCWPYIGQAKVVPDDPNDESRVDLCPEDCVRWCCWNDFRLARHGAPGGKGGLGGNPGYIEIRSTAPNMTFSNVITGGDRGQNGTGGKGAKGKYIKPEEFGQGDNAYLKTLNIQKYDKFYEERWCTNRFNKSIKQGFPQLKDGTDGEDARDPKPPEKNADFNLHHVIQAVHQYKIISRLASHLFSRPKMIKYTEYMERNRSMDKVFRTIDFVQEFLDLERQSPQLLKYEATPLIHHYTSLSRRAIGRLKRGNDSDEGDGGEAGGGGDNGTTNMTRAADVASDDERALLFVHAAASGKTLAFRNPFEPFHITNILDFLNQEKTTMTELQKSVELTEQYQYLHRLTDGYYQGVLKHFEEAFFYMDKVLEPELVAIREYLDRIWRFILQRIQSLKQQGASVIKELERYRRELITHTGVTLFFQAIELAGVIVGLFTQAASVLFDAAAWVKDLIPGPGMPPSFSLPPVILAGSANAAFRFRTAGLSSLRAFMTQIDIVKFVLDTHADKFAKALRVINETNTTVMEYIFDPDKKTDDFAPQDAYNSFRLWVGLDLVIKDGQKNVTAAIKEDSANLGGGGGQAGRAAISLPAAAAGRRHNHKHDHHHNSHNIVKRMKPGGGGKPPIMIPMLSDMETANLALDLAQRGTRYFMALRENIEAIIEVGKSIEKIKDLLKILDEYEKRVKEGLLQEVNDLFDSLDNLGGDLTDLSKSALNILKWRIQSTVRDMIVQYSNQFVKGFIVEEYMKRAFERLDEAVTTMVTVFERLVDYQDQSKLANFTAAANQNPGYMLGKLKDDILEQKVSGLRFMLQGGVLVKRHTLMASSFRQWFFPFVTPSLCNLNLGQLVANDLADHQQLTVLLGTLLTRTNGMIQTVKDWKNGITPFDKYIIKNRYSHQKPHRPFFRWRNSSHYDDIKSLLSKQTVQLFAKAAEGPKSCEAIKFKQISLYFQSSSSSGKEEEKKLVKALEDYKVEMLHMGTSYYSFANETFVLKDQELLFSFSFKVDRHGVPVIKNGVYDKLLSGDITTSPYASWSIAIIPVNDDEYTADITPYIGLMDLYLEGNGTCVERQYAQENLHARPDCSDYGKY